MQTHVDVRRALRLRMHLTVRVPLTPFPPLVESSL
jgi:hypothetical protein